MQTPQAGGDVPDPADTRRRFRSLFLDAFAAVVVPIQGTDLQNILRFIIRLSQVYRNIDLRQ